MRCFPKKELVWVTIIGGMSRGIGGVIATFSNIPIGIYNVQNGQPQQVTTISGTLSEQ